MKWWNGGGFVASAPSPTQSAFVGKTLDKGLRTKTLPSSAVRCPLSLYFNKPRPHCLKTVNGLTREEFTAAALGFVKASGFSAIAVKGGEATLDDVVGRSDSLGESAAWKPVSTNAVTVSAPGERGFFIVVPQVPDADGFTHSSPWYSPTE